MQAARGSNNSNNNDDDANYSNELGAFFSNMCSVLVLVRLFGLSTKLLRHAL